MGVMSGSPGDVWAPALLSRATGSGVCYGDCWFMGGDALCMVSLVGASLSLYTR